VPHGPVRAIDVPVQMLSLKVVTSGTLTSGA
jgi:hypothetical protein